MRPLASDYSVEVDRICREEWFDIISMFKDNNIYQTWSYESARNNRISHLVLCHRERVVAAAQARIVKLPIMKSGIAYIRWGPLWKLLGEGENVETLRHVLRAIRNEYVSRRHLLLRLYPVIFDHEAHVYQPVLKDEGYVLRGDLDAGRTLIIDLTASLDQIRKGLAETWRRHLKQAEKNNLTIIEGNRDDLFALFLPLYREMLQRKQFVDWVDIEEFREIQKDLPEPFKMKIMVCMSDCRNIGAGVICSALGDTGIYLFGATNELGLTNAGSYLLQWQIIRWLKEIGVAKYNLHGINPIKNPGGYQFKAGLSGKNGKDVRFIGQYEAFEAGLGVCVVRFGELLRSGLRRIATKIMMICL